MRAKFESARASLYKRITSRNYRGDFNRIKSKYSLKFTPKTLAMPIATVAMYAAMIHKMNIQNQSDCEDAYPFQYVKYNFSITNGDDLGANCRVEFPNRFDETRPVTYSKITEFLSLSSEEQENFLKLNGTGIRSTCWYYTRMYNEFVCQDSLNNSDSNLSIKTAQ